MLIYLLADMKYDGMLLISLPVFITTNSHLVKIQPFEK